jgi:anti-sigma B factor antagonist
MKFTERRIDDVVIVDLSGKLTIGKGDVALRSAVLDLLDRDEKKIVLNLGGVTYMDSAGTGELVASYTSASNRGAKLVLLNLTSKLRDLLMFTQLISVFDSYHDEAEAIAAFDD